MRFVSRTTAVAIVLAAAAVLSSVVSPAPATADEVATAKARVARLQAEVKTVTRTLTEGTRKYEADQRALQSAQRQLDRARRDVTGMRAQAAAGSAQLDRLAKQMYMSPAPSGLQIALTQGPDQVLESMQLNRAVAHVAGSQVELVRKAVAARVALQAKEQAITGLTRTASQLAARSAARLRELNALASRTATALENAQNALASAQGKAAAAARSRAERASRSRQVVAFTGPSCTGRTTGGQSNGNLDPGSLCPLWMAPGERLRADAAAGFNAMSKARAASTGSPLCVTDSYRSYSEQVSVYRRKPGLAAVPGTSEHGWGKAVDLCGGVERFGSEAYGWMTQNAGRFGFFHPDWARQGGSKPEPWHWEYGG